MKTTRTMATVYTTGLIIVLAYVAMTSGCATNAVTIEYTEEQTIAQACAAYRGVHVTIPMDSRKYEEWKAIAQCRDGKVVEYRVVEARQ